MNIFGSFGGDGNDNSNDRNNRKENNDNPNRNNNRDFKGDISTEISPHVQRHLQLVYGNLSMAALTASLACLLFIRGFLGNASILPAILGLVCLFMIPRAESTPLRRSLLAGFGFFNGWSMAPLVDMVFNVDMSCVLWTLLATAAIFISFTVSALVSPRRSQLYLGGILGTGLLVVGIASMANIFFGSNFLFNAEIWIGLAIFSGYILYDTQVIVESAESGMTDDVIHAAQLFTNLAAIFIRLLIILSRMNEQGERGRGNQQRKRNNRSD